MTHCDEKYENAGNYFQAVEAAERVNEAVQRAPTYVHEQIAVRSGGDSQFPLAAIQSPKVMRRGILSYSIQFPPPNGFGRAIRPMELKLVSIRDEPDGSDALWLPGDE
ncbi:MAG TPA: hypothetical protein VKB08_12790, partial [Bradyrhizobium sp.]|nr:hypothetical protein [Bradyrhizobium sp.]